MRDTLKFLIPRKIRKAVRDILGITALQERVSHLEELLYEAGDGLWEKSRERWRESAPTVHLTWGQELSGESFIQKSSSYDVFGPDKAVLEIGPGYGRLLKSMVEQNVQFKKYLGLDISEKHVKYLRETFRDSKINFLHADAENVSFDNGFDVVLSSLTFKHLFPSFEATLRNVTKYVSPGGLFLFDLIEGKQKHFEFDQNVVTSLREYTRPEIEEILSRVGLELVAFDEVWHDQEHMRLLVVARKAK